MDSTAVTLLPFLGAPGAATIFVGVAIIFGVWLPQWVGRRADTDLVPADPMDLDAEAPTGRFHRDFGYDDEE